MRALVDELNAYKLFGQDSIRLIVDPAQMSGSEGIAFCPDVSPWGGNPLVQATPANQPTLVQNVCNGQPGIYFNGASAQKLANSRSPCVGGFTAAFAVFNYTGVDFTNYNGLVCENTTNAAKQAVIFAGDGGGTKNQLYNLTGGYMRVNKGAAVNVSTSVDFATPSLSDFKAVFVGNRTSRVYPNGLLLGQAATDLAASYWTGYLLFLLLLKITPTTATQDLFFEYLKARFKNSTNATMW